MPNICDEDGGSKVNPFISLSVINTKVCRSVPHQRKLALHGSRFTSLQRAEYRLGSRRGDRGLNFPVFSIYGWCFLRASGKNVSAHNSKFRFEINDLPKFGLWRSDRLSNRDLFRYQLHGSHQ